MQKSTNVSKCHYDVDRAFIGLEYALTMIDIVFEANDQKILKIINDHLNLMSDRLYTIINEKEWQLIIFSTLTVMGRTVQIHRKINIQDEILGILNKQFNILIDERMGYDEYFIALKKTIKEILDNCGANITPGNDLIGLLLGPIRDTTNFILSLKIEKKYKH